MARPVPTLVAALVRTRELVERMIARLEAEVELSVSDEQRLRRGRRAVRKINNEHLPWARSPAFTEAQAAGVRLWMHTTWRQLSLAQFEEG